MILQGGTDIPFPDAVSLFCCLLRYSEQKVQHYKAQSQGQQVLYAYGKKWAQVFPCPGRQSRQKALYLGQTSLQQGTIPILLLPRLPSPLPHGNGVNRCSHTDLEVAVHHPGGPRQQLLSLFQAAAALITVPLLPAAGAWQGQG